MTDGNPVPSPVYTITPKEVLPKYEPVNKQPVEIRYTRIETGGPNRGWYRRTPPLDFNNANTVYTKVKLPNTIKGMYSDYMEYRNGYYYLPRRPQIPIRKLLYGLQNYQMPTSGNTELFNFQFNGIRVPRGYCPFIDPCVYDWCIDCIQQARSRYNLNKTDRPSFLGVIFVIVFVFTMLVYVSLALFI